ncbi:hypothetical protein HYS96_00015 [Candidatus Daviesbacteria bacterium]|nr:hypothetical protein [Candidatus Daviesbacteria bacterium]
METDKQQVIPDPTQPDGQSPVSSAENKKKFILSGLILLVILIIGAITAFYLGKSPSKNESPSQLNKVTSNQSPKVLEAKFAHFQYLSKPNFGKAVPSSFVQPSEYSVKGSLPSAQQVVSKSKISLIPVAFAGGEVNLPVYRASRHEITKDDAIILASKFGMNGEPKKDGYEPPAYYGFIWDDNNGYFSVIGGSGTGGYEFYQKGPGLSGSAPSDDEAKGKAKEFLLSKGLIDDSYFISGVLGNVSDISKRTGFREDHKQVYFRKKLQGYQVYDWIGGGGSPIADKIEVWVGVNGRILYAFDPSFWTTVDTNNKTDYLLKEPTAVFEGIKAGKGKLAWIDYDAINISTGGYGPSAPGGNFVFHGRLKNVEIESVDLAYYHQQEAIENSEFYQPIYLFKAQATLDWKDDYTPQGAGEEFLRGKRTTVTLIASAAPDNYFFETPITLAQGGVTQPSAPIPVYYPPVIKNPTPAPTNPTNTIPTTPAQQEKQSFILKLGVVTDLDDLKRNVVLSWEDVSGTVKYNIYLKIAGDNEYNQAALVGTGNLSETVGVNKYIDYYFKVQACNANRCIESNEVFLPQEQKPTFYMKLGTVTPGEDPKIEVVLSWSEYPGTVKYNVFLRNSPIEEYGAALTGTGELSYQAVVNRHNDNYFIVQACNNETCYPSNEIFLPKQ